MRTRAMGAIVLIVTEDVTLWSPTHIQMIGGASQQILDHDAVTTLG